MGSAISKKIQKASKKSAPMSKSSKKQPETEEKDTILQEIIDEVSAAAISLQMEELTTIKEVLAEIVDQVVEETATEWEIDLITSKMKIDSVSTLLATMTNLLKCNVHRESGDIGENSTDWLMELALKCNLTACDDGRKPLAARLGEGKEASDLAKKLLKRFVTTFVSKVGENSAHMAADLGHSIVCQHFPDMINVDNYSHIYLFCILSGLKSLQIELEDLDGSWIGDDSCDQLKCSRSLLFAIDALMRNLRCEELIFETDKIDRSNVDIIKTEHLAIDPAFIVENIQADYPQSVLTILKNASIGAFDNQAMNMMRQNAAILLNKREHMQLFISSIPAVEEALDLRIREGFYMTMKSCRQNLSRTDLIKSVAFAVAQKKQIKPHSNIGKKLVENFDTTFNPIHDEESLFNDISWGLLIDPNTTVAYILENLMLLKHSEDECKCVVSCLRNFLSLVSVRIPLKLNLKWAFMCSQIWTFLTSKATAKSPDQLDRLAFILRALCEDFVSPTELINDVLIDLVKSGRLANGIFIGTVTQLLQTATKPLKLNMQAKKMKKSAWGGEFEKKDDEIEPSIDIPWLLNFALKLYKEPDAAEKNRRQWQKMGQFFASVRTCLNGEKFVQSGVNWLMEETRSVHWRIRFVVFNHLLQDNYSWPNQIPLSIIHGIASDSIRKQSKALNEILSLFQVSTEETIVIEAIESALKIIKARLNLASFSSSIFHLLSSTETPQLHTKNDAILRQLMQIIQPYVKEPIDLKIVGDLYVEQQKQNIEKMADRLNYISGGKQTDWMKNLHKLAYLLPSWNQSANNKTEDDSPRGEKTITSPHNHESAKEKDGIVVGETFPGGIKVGYDCHYPPLGGRAIAERDAVPKEYRSPRSPPRPFTNAQFVQQQQVKEIASWPVEGKRQLQCFNCGKTGNIKLYCCNPMSAEKANTYLVPDGHETARPSNSDKRGVKKEQEHYNYPRQPCNSKSRLQSSAQLDLDWENFGNAMRLVRSCKNDIKYGKVERKHKSVIECQHCHKIGHLSRYCPNEHSGPGRNNRGSW